MNIQTASNFEINKAITESKGWAIAEQIGAYDTVFVTEKEWHDEFDYCNEWRDCGPLLQENGITLSYIESKEEGNVWMAGKYVDDETQPASFNKNPLRAVCEVYLEILANQGKGG